MEDEAVKEEGEPKDPQATPAAPETPVVPENKEEKPAGAKPAEEAPESGETDEKNLPSEEKGRLFEIKKLRADRRALREENERSQERIKALESGRQQPLPDNNQEGAVDELRTVDERVRNVLQQERIKEHREEAFNHILSQDDVTTDKELKEIGDVMCDTGLDELAKTKPFQAAELALHEWRRIKISESKKSSPSEKASAQDMPKGGVKPGGGAPAKKLWSRKDISKMSDEDYEKNRSELLAASKEGRIK